MAKRRGHNDGSIYQRESDGRWVAAISLPDGSRRVFYAATRKEAQLRLREAQRTLDAGLPLGDARLTLGDYLDGWLTGIRGTVEDKTWRGHEQFARLHIAPALGWVKLRDLAPRQVQDLYGTLLAEKGLSTTTVHHLHASLHKALEAAMRAGIVALNVCDRVDAPRMRHHEIAPLTREEARVLLDVATGDRLYALYSLALHTGMRENEMLSLRWSDLELDGAPPVARVRQQLKRVDGAWVAGKVKTQRSRRPVVLTARVVRDLRAHAERQRAEATYAGDVWERGEGDLVFCTRTGGRLLARNVVRGFKRLLVEAALPDIRFHDLRHTCATLLLTARVNPKVVSELLGHASVAITLDIYSHVLPDMQQDAASAMATLLDE